MQEKKKSGPVCCGQNLRKLRFYRGVSYVALCLGIGGGLGWLGLENMAQAAICFLPDCGDKILEFQGDANLSTQYCRNAGYTYYELGQCPPYYHQEVCPDNSHYLKCDAQKWCQDNGYQLEIDDCTVPMYADEQCLNGLHFYKQCKADYDKACHEEDADYVSECREGWILDSNELCSYSPLYGKCCNECEDYQYEEDEIPQGYQKGESCLACGDITKYKKELYDCAAEGFIRCDKGGQTGTEVCWRGDEKWYKECCAPCDDYPYLESQIPEGYVKGDSCDSCDGMKYKTKVGECAEGYEWKDESCKKSCDNTCSVGNILYSDHTCSSCKVSGKTPIGVVSYASGSTRLAINLVNMEMPWGGHGTDISGLTNYTSGSTAKNDFSGKSNTSIIVSALGDTSSYAAGYCYNFTTSGTSKGYWYLPAQGELYASIVTNYSAVNSGLSAAGGTSVSRYHWSSSEYSYATAWYVGAYGGVSTYFKADSSFYVRCVLGFEDMGNGTAKVCDKEYIYSCSVDSSTHITGGVGDSCAGTYKSCKCAVDYVWDNGECKPLCQVGDILYSDLTCSVTLDSSKVPIGIIGYKNNNERLAVSLDAKYGRWGWAQDYKGIRNYTSVREVLSDFNGRENTFAHYKISGTSYSAGVCYNYQTSGTLKNQWYLPAMGELNYFLINNREKINSGYAAAGKNEISSKYASSSELSYIHGWELSSGRPYDDIKGNYEGTTLGRSPRLMCTLPLDVDEAGKIKICSADYRYRCQGMGYANGSGDTCAGLYKSCECIDGYEWVDGMCTIPSLIGQILFNDLSISAEKEDGKIPIGVIGYVDGSKALAVSLKESQLSWSPDSNDVYGIGYGSSVVDEKNYFDGKPATLFWVDHYGANADGYAPGYCYNYVTAATSTGDWYLPASGELLATIWPNFSSINNGLTKIEATPLSETRYFASSPDNGYSVYAGINSGGSGSKQTVRSVRCVLPIEINENRKARICDRSYVSTCSGINELAGVGESCGGFYASCTCSPGYEWKNRECLKTCKEGCEVGSIVYSDFTCNACKLKDKTPIGVVGYEKDGKKVAVALSYYEYGQWSRNASSVDVQGITNYSDAQSALSDWNGKGNTSAWLNELSSVSDSGDAVIKCSKYSPNGDKSTTGEWYLPALGELEAIRVKNKAIIESAFVELDITPISGSFMSSTERIGSDGKVSSVWIIDYDGQISYSYKSSINSDNYICVLEF